MKILKLLPYVGLAIVFLLGIYLFYKSTEQEKLIDYLTYVSTSSSEVSEKINSQSEEINSIDNFSKISEEKIVELERLSEDLDVFIKEKREGVDKYNRPEEVKDLDADFAELLSSSEKVNENYKELLLSIKNLESTEKVLEEVKMYNDSITILSEVLKETERELNNLTDNKDSLFKLI